MAARGGARRHVAPSRRCGLNYLAERRTDGGDILVPPFLKQPWSLPPVAAVCSPSVLPELGDILFFLSFIYIPCGCAVVPR